MAKDPIEKMVVTYVAAIKKIFAALFGLALLVVAIWSIWSPWGANAGSVGFVLFCEAAAGLFFIFWSLTGEKW
ncbi:MAG: hypothetical protein GZ088_09575 [Acidipila sp.]|nr:hypothetical protein [Acidipila sp.]